MKRNLFIVLILIGVGSIGNAQDSKTQKKQDNYDKVLAVIESGKFEFVARKANPQGGRQIDLTTNPNYLRIKGNNGEAVMPYFGRSFSGGYGTSGGIEFNGEFMEYSVERNDDKFKVVIVFSIKGENDTYKGTITVTGMENASLTISSNNKQVISYYGNIKPLE
jgi:hypothetical protein